MNAGHESVFNFFLRLLRVRTGAAAFLLWGLSATAHAQNALQSALSQDTIVQPRQNGPVDLRPDQSHWGPVQFTLGAYAGAEYNDNIYGAQYNPQANILVRGGLNLGIFWPATGQSALSFSTGLGYAKYLNIPGDSGFEVTPNSALSYIISLPEGSLAFFDQISYSRQVVAQASLANIATLPIFQNAIGTRGTWEPGKLTLQAGYSHNLSLSAGASSGYQFDGASYGNLDNSSDNFFGRAGWRFAEATQAGVEGSAGLTQYRQATQNGNLNYTVGSYLEWQARPAIKLTVRGGPSLISFDGPSAGVHSSSILNSYYFSLDLDHRLTDFVSQRLVVARLVQPSWYRGSDYNEQLSATYSLSYALTDRISLGASVFYERGRQPLPVLAIGPYVFEIIENYDRYGAGPQFSWHLTEKTAATLNYSFIQRTSNLPGRSYNQNIVSLSVRYTF